MQRCYHFKIIPKDKSNIQQNAQNNFNHLSSLVILSRNLAAESNINCDLDESGTDSILLANFVSYSYLVVVSNKMHLIK